MNKKSFINYLRTNLDEITIISCLATLQFKTDKFELSEEELMVLSALERATPSLQDAPLEEVKNYLAIMEENQLGGIVSKVKGILHEMEFVRLENEDGDGIFAAMYESTNHPGFDVNLVDANTGESWDVQLKATDNESYVKDWIDIHPDGEILITEELASEMGLASSGLSNEQLTISVENFVDKLLSAEVTSSIWDFVPGLSLVSISVMLNELWQRKLRGEIENNEFKKIAAQATGLKISKILVLTTLLTMPLVGQVTGAILIARLLLNAKNVWFDKPPTYVAKMLSSA
jgi:hypothetical protein